MPITINLAEVYTLAKDFTNVYDLFREHNQKIEIKIGDPAHKPLIVAVGILRSFLNTAPYNLLYEDFPPWKYIEEEKKRLDS